MQKAARIKLLLFILLQAILFSLVAGIFGVAASGYANAFDGEVFSDAPPAELADLQSAGSGQLDHWADALKRFDGRDYGYITPEGNQGSLGICWAYAAVGAVEANILRDSVDPEVDKDTLDLDEMIAAYARFNRDGENDPLYLTSNDVYDSDTWKSSGDFADNAILSMTQGYSLVDQVSNQNWSNWALKQRLAPSKYFVQGFKQIDHNEDAIKRAILEYGGVTMEYKAPETIYQQYVCHTGSGAGHASLIIGWDDDVPASSFWPDTPTSDGAWIVKNSWGYGGDKGVNGTCCFYLSYDSYMTDNLYVVDMALRDDYQNIYFYDGFIAENTSQYYADAYGAIYQAKLSTANEREQLTAVSFGIRDAKSTVDIEIYRLASANFGNVNDEANKPDEGVLIGKKRVRFEDDGFYTVDLDEPIELEQGEIFSIVISGRDDNGGYLDPYFAQDGVDSVNDMTYRKYMDEWTSFKGYKNTYPGSSAGSCVRLRAITNVVKTQDDFDNDLRFARMELESKFTYYEKDTPKTPELTVYFGSRILQEGEDYDVKYIDNLLPGTATVRISGLNEYYGEQSVTFEIAKPKYPPGKLDERIEVYSDATRLSQVPTPEGWRWSETQDIVLVNGDSGFGYQLKYTGEDADCYQFSTCSVKIFKNNFPRPAQLDIAGSAVTISGKYTYTGAQIAPSVRVVCKGHELKPDADYTLEYQSNVNVGVATVVVRGRGAYEGQITKQFEIKKAKWPSERPKNVIYVSESVKTLSQVPLNAAGWSWQENLELVGEEMQAVAIYTGAGMNNFVNTKTVVTVVRGSERKSISTVEELRLEGAEFVYDGQAKTPSVIARDGERELLQGVDFDVEYRDNENAGQASAVVKGKNEYTGVKTLYFTIGRASRADFKVAQAGWSYGEQPPAPSVQGQMEDAPVTYAYSDSENGEYIAARPTKAGAYWIKATISQTQNYLQAEARAPFVISKAARPDEMPPSAMSVARKVRSLREIPLDAHGWQWEAPDTKISAAQIKAWAVYADRDDYEVWRVEITLTKEAPLDALKLNVSLAEDAFVYDGEEKTPDIIALDGDIALSPGEDFDVTYQNNKFVGTAKAIVAFKNDYRGTKELAFTILQADAPSADTTLYCDSSALRLSDVTLPADFVWADDSAELSGPMTTAQARYVGEDAYCYKTTELTFEIIRDEAQDPQTPQDPQEPSVQDPQDPPAQDAQNSPANTRKKDLLWLAIVLPIVLILAALAAVLTATRLRRRRTGK